VQKARKINSIKIVTYDWLEDSLQMRSRRREGLYLLAKVEKSDKKLKAERKVKERRALKKEGKILRFPLSANLIRALSYLSSSCLTQPSPPLQRWLQSSSN
jgi:hypothetical protein